MFQSKKERDPELKKWFGKGCEMSAQGKHEEAIKCYNEGLKIDPMDWACWNNKGAAFDKLGMEEEHKQCMQLSTILMVSRI